MKRTETWEIEDTVRVGNDRPFVEERGPNGIVTRSHRYTPSGVDRQRRATNTLLTWVAFFVTVLIIVSLLMTLHH